MGVEGKIDPVERRRNRSGSWVGGLILLASASAGILYLRHIVDNVDPPSKPPFSVETTRIRVERAIDAEATKVKRTPVPTTLHALRALSRPWVLDEDRLALANKRAGPLETQVWTLRARVIDIVVRADEDFYLVIDADGLRGCVEIPDPRLCRTSPFADQIAAVRKQIDSELHPTRTPKQVDRLADLTGIGCFGTAGHNDNGARLTPLLKLRWIDR